MEEIKKIGYSKQEAALALTISVRKLDELINSGVLKTINIGSRVIINAKSMERLMEVGAVPYEKGA